MKTKDILKLVEPYCSRIRYTGKHYVCSPIGSKRIITMSVTSSDRNFHKQVYREFRREGVNIVELASKIK